MVPMTGGSVPSECAGSVDWRLRPSFRLTDARTTVPPRSTLSTSRRRTTYQAPSSAIAAVGSIALIVPDGSRSDPMAKAELLVKDLIRHDVPRRPS